MPIIVFLIAGLIAVYLISKEIKAREEVSQSLDRKFAEMKKSLNDKSQ